MLDNFKRSIKNATLVETDEPTTFLSPVKNNRHVLEVEVDQACDVTTEEVILASVQQACEDMLNTAPNSNPEDIIVVIPSTIKRHIVVIDANKGSE